LKISDSPKTGFFTVKRKHKLHSREKGIHKRVGEASEHFIGLGKETNQSPKEAENQKKENKRIQWTMKRGGVTKAVLAYMHRKKKTVRPPKKRTQSRCEEKQEKEEKRWHITLGKGGNFVEAFPKKKKEN